MQLARHIESVILALPHGVKVIEARADSVFVLLGSGAGLRNKKHRCRFIVVARKTPRLVEEAEISASEALSRHRCR